MLYFIPHHRYITIIAILNLKSGSCVSGPHQSTAHIRAKDSDIFIKDISGRPVIWEFLNFITHLFSVIVKVRVVYWCQLSLLQVAQLIQGAR